MEHYSFSEDAIKDALEAAKATHNEAVANTKGVAFDISKSGGMQAGTLSISAQCIAITTANHKICINLPLGIGSHCFTLPVSIPNGTVGKACLSFCTTFGVPSGIRVKVVIGGVTVLSQAFGFGC